MRGTISRMHDEVRRRLAGNEALFRETNEAIERGQWSGEPDDVVRFRCECSRVDCGEAVEISLAGYERVRASPRRFIVAKEHDDPRLEDVVVRTDRYLVVEKRGEGGEVAEATDPRG